MCLQDKITLFMIIYIVTKIIYIFNLQRLTNSKNKKKIPVEVNRQVDQVKVDKTIKIKMKPFSIYEKSKS